MNDEIDNLIQSVERDLQRRRAIISIIFFGLLALSIASAYLLFRVEAPIFSQLMGDDHIGFLFAIVIEVAKPLLTLCAWFVVSSPTFRSPLSVKVAGVFLLPLLLWGVSTFCVFSGVALSTNHPNLEATRKADIDALIAEYENRTNILHVHASAEIGELDGRLNAQREQFNTSVADARRTFGGAEQSMRDQLLSEVRAAGDEQDFEKLQKIALQNDALIQRDREILRRDYEVRKQQVAREKDAAIWELDRQRVLFGFRKDNGDKKTEIVAAFQRSIEKLTKEFEAKDNTLRAQLKSGATVAGTSHAVIAKSLEARLDSLSKSFQTATADNLGKQRLADAEIGRERRAIHERLEHALAEATSAFGSRLGGIKSHDYSGDPRVENRLVNDTLATIRDGFGVSFSRAGFVAAFALAASAAIEGVLWVATVWCAVLLTTLFLGGPFDPEAAVKKNFFANTANLNGSRVVSNDSEDEQF